MNKNKLNSIVAGSPKSIKVNDINIAIRLWKSQLKENNVIEQCYANSFYLNPSTIRKNKKKSGRKTNETKDNFNRK